MTARRVSDGERGGGDLRVLREARFGPSATHVAGTRAAFCLPRHKCDLRLQNLRRVLAGSASFALLYHEQDRKTLGLGGSGLGLGPSLSMIHTDSARPVVASAARRVDHASRCPSHTPYLEHPLPGTYAFDPALIRFETIDLDRWRAYIPLLGGRKVAFVFDGEIRPLIRLKLKQFWAGFGYAMRQLSAHERMLWVVMRRAVIEQEPQVPDRQQDRPDI